MRSSRLAFAIIAIGFSMLAHASKSADDDFLDRATRNSPPLKLIAKVPAATIRISEATPCAIEEIAGAKLNAIGGRYIKLNGDYLNVCAWVAGDKMHVYDELGKERVLPVTAFKPDR